MVTSNRTYTGKSDCYRKKYVYILVKMMRFLCDDVSICGMQYYF
jgi:hypothetical protein